MNSYTVVLRGNPVNSAETCTATYEDVMAPNSARAEEEAAAMASYDGYENVSIIKITEDTNSYSPYSFPPDQMSATSDFEYTSYRSAVASLQETNYTPYGSLQTECAESYESDVEKQNSSGYQPYVAVKTTASGSEAPESWHSAMDNGYCPYRSFRNVLPPGYKLTT